MPGNVGITVQGAYVVRPGVYTTIDASAMVPVRPGPGGVVGFVGPADGGAPATVYEFTSYSEALSVLRGGPSLAYIARIFAPSGQTNGASKIRFVRCGAPTRSTLTAAGLTFTSKDYGRHANSISFKSAAGSGSTVDVTIGKANDGFTKTYNCGLGILVKSTATTPKIVFDHSAKQAKLYENAVIVQTLDYPTEQTTLANLVSWINGRAGWTASVAGSSAMPVAYMDNPVLGDAPSILTTDTALPASQGNLVWQLNNDPLSPITAAAIATYDDIAVVAQTLFASGSGTGYDTFSSSDYSTALAYLETVSASFIFLADSSASVQGVGLAHCVTMRSVTRKRWRIFFTGGAPGENSSAAITAAKGLDGPVVYAWNGTSYSNPVSGLVENLGGLGTAAQLCGMAAGTWASESITNKGITAQALEFPNATDSQIDACLVGGVTPIAYDPSTGAPTVVQGLTTYQRDANVAYRKLVGLRIQDALYTGFQAALSKYVGWPMDLSTGRSIYNDVAKFLDLSTRSPENPGGILTQGYSGGQVQPSWLNLHVTGDGLDSWAISVETHPVGETAFITVVCKLTPVAISL